MHVVSHKTLEAYYDKGNSKAKIPLERWFNVAKHAEWKTLADIKKDYPSVDYVGNQRYVFNIHGNDYRLVVVIQFTPGKLYIRWVGTHAEYDKIDCKTI